MINWQQDFASSNSRGPEQGWRSVESAPLPPMCPGFDSQTHMFSTLLREVFAGTPVFSSPEKPTFDLM